jgi:peptidoglycan hydrolase CwlO-like protein
MLSIIMTLILMTVISSNVFASPNTSTSDELKQTQNDKKEVQTKIQDLNNQIDDVMKNVDKNKQDMNKIAKDMKNTQAKLETAQKNSKAQEDLFAKRLRAMYINGSDTYLQVLLSSENLGDFISRLDMVTRVIGYDKNVVNKLKLERQAISDQKKALDSENAKLQALKTTNESKLSKLNNDIKEQKDLLGKVTEKEGQLLAKESASKEAASAKEVASAKSSPSSSGTLSRGTSGSGSSSYSQVLDICATAYSGDGITASGTATKRNSGGYSTIAVDPRVIPIGSRVYVDGYGYAVAEDTGGDIKGNRIDVFFNSEAEAQNWGVRPVKVYILN